MAILKPLACGFHAHSHFSLDGGSTVQKLVARAKELGRPAMCLTDHGNMNGLADLHMSCTKAGIKAIHGIELYVVNDQWSPPRDDGKQTYKHLTVHFVTQKAYEWFCSKSVVMEQRATVIFGERKPILHWNELLEISDEIVLGSGCLGSFVMSAVRAGNFDLAERIYQELRSAVRPGRFFVEIFPHRLTEEWQRPKWDKATKKKTADGFFKPNDPDPECGHAPKDTQRIPNMFLLSLAEKYKDPVVLSEDCVQAGTMVRVPYGMKPIEQISAGDHVLTHLGRYRKVLATKSVLTQEAVLEFHFRGFNPLVVTKEHRILVKKPSKTKAPFAKTEEQRWLAAQELEVGDFVFIPKSKPFGFGHFNRIDLAQFFHHNVKNVVIGKTTLQYSEKAERKTPRFIDLTPETFFIFGLFLGDGNAHGHLVGFAFENETFDKVAPYIEQFARQIECNYDIQTLGNCRIIRLSSTVVSKFFRDNFYKNKQKSIPWWVWEATPENKLEVVRGICWSDGGNRNGTEHESAGVAIGTNNKEIPSFVREVMSQNGVFCSIASRKTNGSTSLTYTVSAKREIFDKCKLWAKPAKRIRAPDNKTDLGWWVRVTEIQLFRSNLSFHDLTVEEDHSFATESIAVHNCHVATKSEHSTQTIKMGRGADSWRFSTAYSMETPDFWYHHLVDQMGENLINVKKVEEFVDNSYQFMSLFDNYKFETSKDRWVLPTTEVVFGDTYKNSTNKEILKKLIIAHGRMPTKTHPQFKEYVDRLSYEVSVLSDNGKLDLLPYFFVLADLVKWAKDNGRICQARGSAGGSLVAYLLGITVTDPIKWGLQFERFLTLGRILSNTLPDIDADFDQKDIVMKYLMEKYGDKLSKISINTLLKVKSSIRDVERVELGEVRLTTETLCRKLPNIDQGLDPIKWLNGYEDDSGAFVPGFIEDKGQEAEMLRQYVKDNPKIWEEVQKCLGIVRQKSSHACGVVLADENITKYTPITVVGDDLVTGYCPKGCEYKGLVKFDILGVKTLEACRVAMASIAEHTDEKMIWEEFPHDPDVFDFIISKKLLCGVFQIGTSTMKPFVYSLLPKTTPELANLVALVRPGTLDAPVRVSDSQTLTASDVFVQCAQGKRSPRFIHPDLRPILDSTYGILLFQEQALSIFRVIGGFSYEEAEVARRGIGKKDKALLAQELGKLANNIRTKGTWTDAQIDELCDTIIASARYSFNKSHAAAYAVVAYNCMYLKYHFPIHFYKGILEVNNDDHDEIREIMKEAGHYVLPPDILKSHPTAWTIEDTALRAPLCLIKGVGALTAAEIKEFLVTGIEKFDKKPEKPAPKRKSKKNANNVD